MLGIVDDLAGRALLHDDAAVHKDEVVGHVASETHLVSDDDHGHVLGRQIADDLQHLAGQLRIQRARGLVEEQHVRIHGHGTGDGHALLLTARQVARHHRLLVRQPHASQKLAATSERLVLRHLLHADERIGDVLQHGVVREQVEILEHEPETGLCSGDDVLAPVNSASCSVVGAHREVAVGKVARIKGFQQRHAAQKRRLAAARGPDDGQHVASVHRQRNILQNLVVPERLLAVGEAYDRFAFHETPPSRGNNRDASRHGSG